MDYISFPAAVLMFNPPELRMCLDIPIIDDDVSEGSETFIVLLPGQTDPAVMAISPQVGTIEILDNDDGGFESRCSNGFMSSF